MALTDNTRGALLMAVAMASFTANDALTKSVTPYINTGQIMFVRGIMTAILVYFAARHFGALRPLKTLLRPIIILRCLCEVTAAVLYLTALGLIEFSNASAILQSLPLVVTLGAALFLREPVGWRRWLAIIVGFLGVLVILRPGPDGFTFGALLVVASLAVTAARDLLTRKMYADVPSLAVTVITAFVNMAMGGLLIQPFGGWQPMNGWIISHLAGSAVLVLIGYQAIIVAMRTGEISFVAPFRYTSLLWGFMIGIFFFNERIDSWTIVGAAIVIGSGLYTFYRESKRNRSQLAKRSAVTPTEPPTVRPASVTEPHVTRSMRAEEAGE
ncbi:DMT family transporter [Agrobacterium sp. NPDC090273]|uniref:DMT family transporter n=1 Tax=Agrobacterium TaxID=357 RepID=UPI0021CF61A2|nr:DMT family transporter [Agrobacterium tumefaciens]UXS01512.1 DMT family transporter [Agrobacterium tumefaciens]